MKTNYMVMAVIKSTEVELKDLGLKQDLPLTWADGMVGVIPVFKDEESAKKYAGKVEIVELTMAKEPTEPLIKCGECGAEMQIIRPGKYQCPDCE